VVCNAMDGILAEGLEGDQVSEAEEILARARGVTTRLSETVDAMQQGISVDTRLMREDAHIFLKVVVQLSNLIKIHGTKCPVPSALRMNMVKLTNSTEEFAVLLHVSSFSPSATSARPYSPMIIPSTLSPSLSRSRSAQGSSISRQRSNLNVTTMVEPPKSAQPTQTFKLPMMRRVRV
jgi:hypothetical protein